MGDANHEHLDRLTDIERARVQALLDWLQANEPVVYARSKRLVARPRRLLAEYRGVWARTYVDAKMAEGCCLKKAVFFATDLLELGGWGRTVRTALRLKRKHIT